MALLKHDMQQPGLVATQPQLLLMLTHKYGIDVVRHSIEQVVKDTGKPLVMPMPLPTGETFTTMCFPPGWGAERQLGWVAKHRAAIETFGSIDAIGPAAHDRLQEWVKDNT